MSVAEEIKSRLDIVNYIQQYAPLKKAGRHYKACCPFHTEKTPSFIVNPDTQSWRCFGACAEGGDIFSFAMKQHGWSFTEALNELGRQAGVEVRQRTPEQRTRDEALDQLRGLLQVAADVYHQHLLNTNDTGAVDTLRYARERRGLTPETIQRFIIGYAPPGWQYMLEYLTQLGYTEAQVIEAGLAKRSETGRVYDTFRNRLMIPIRDERGRVIGFGARALDPDDNPKYLNSPQTPVFDKSRILFGLDVAKTAIRDSETAVIVEGYMDAIQAHQAGFANVVAQMGTAMTEPQLRLISPRYARKIILALDADAAGQNATMRGLEVARQTLSADFSGRMSVDMRILQIPGAKDPDDLIREDPDRWQTLVDSAVPVADYVIDMETATLPPNATVQEREAVARRLLPILLASENDLYKQDNIQKLSLRLKIGERDLLAWALEQRKIDAARPSPRSYRGAEPPEPPPLDYGSMTAPPDLDAHDRVEPETAPRRPVRAPSGSALEVYCLRRLLRSPELYYRVNRKFRELAGDREDLLNGPLAELGVEDFINGDHRVLMHTFQMALGQDDLDPLDYLRQNLDESLVGELESLLVDDRDDARKRLKDRMYAEIDGSWKQHEKLVIPSVDLNADLIRRALDLRKQRLQRELEDLRFLQMDPLTEDTSADSGQDPLQGARYIVLFAQAKRLIDAELRQLSGQPI